MTEPDDVKAYKEGVALFRQGKVLEALGRFRFAAETGEDRPMEFFALASAYVRVGDWEGARTQYSRFLAMNPGLPQQEAAARVALQKAEAKIAEGRAEAEAAKRAAEEKRRQEALAKVRKVFDEAVAYYRAGGYGSALERLQQLLDSWGRTAEVLNLVGLCHVRLGNHAGAVKALEEALQEDPANADVALNLARAHFDQGTSQAAALLEQCVAGHPDNSQAWFNLGVSRLARSEFNEAAAAWQKVVELDPTDKEAKANLEMVKRRTQ